MKKVAENRISLAGGIKLDSDKLEQIRSGTNLRRTKSGLQTKNIVFTKKDGTKITEKQTKEVVEESTVKRRKRNYVMYVSKLETEKKSEISVLKPKSKPKINPRIEEKIIIKKKRKEYLDNYQYHETRCLKKKNPKKVIVEHHRLGDIISGEFETITVEKLFSRETYNPKMPSKTSTIVANRTRNPQLRTNRSESKLNKNISKSTEKNTSTIKHERSTKIIKNPITQTITTTTIKNTNKMGPQLKSNKSEIRLNSSKKERAKTPANKIKDSATIINRRNNQTITNWRPEESKNKKSETITNQIISRRDKNIEKKYDTKTEIRHSSNSRRDNKPKKEKEEMAKIYTKKIIEKTGATSIENESKKNKNDIQYGSRTITAISRVRRKINDNKDEKPEKGNNSITKEDIEKLLNKEKEQNQTIEVDEPYKTKTEVIKKIKPEKKSIEDKDIENKGKIIYVRRSIRNKYKSKKI